MRDTAHGSAKPLGNRHRLVYRALVSALHRTGRASVSREDWRYWADRLVPGLHGAHDLDAKFRRAVSALVERGVVQELDGCFAPMPMSRERDRWREGVGPLP